MNIIWFLNGYRYVQNVSKEKYFGGIVKLETIWVTENK